MLRAKISIVLLTLFMTPNLANAQDEKSEFLVLDTIEFQMIENQAGKARYLKRVAQILRDMRIQEDDFDSTKLSDADLQNMIVDQDRWSKTIMHIEKACTIELRRQICDRLMQERIDLFDFNLENPEY